MAEVNPQELIDGLLTDVVNTDRGKEIVGSPIDSNGIMSELKNFASKYNIDLFTLLTTSAAKLDQIIRDVNDPFIDGFSASERKERRQQRRLDRKANRAARIAARKERREARAEGTDYAKIKLLKEKLKSQKPTFSQIIEVEGDDGEIIEVDQLYVYPITGRVIDLLTGLPIEGVTVIPAVQPTLNIEPPVNLPIAGVQPVEGLVLNPNNFDFLPQPFLEKKRAGNVRGVEVYRGVNRDLEGERIQGADERTVTDKDGYFTILVNIPTIPSNLKTPLFFSLLFQGASQGYVPDSAIIVNGDMTIKQDIRTVQLLPLKAAAATAVADLVNESEDIQTFINQNLLEPSEKVLALKKESLSELNNMIKSKLLPLCMELLIAFGITKLTQQNSKTCPSPEQLEQVIEKRNRVTRQLNQIYKSFIVNTALAAAFSVLAKTFARLSSQLDNITIPQAVGTPPAKDFGGLIFAQAYSLTGKFQRVKDILEELSQQNTDLNKAILLNVAYIAAGTIIVTELLKAIDKMSQDCAEQAGVTLEEQLAINENLLDLTLEEEDDGNVAPGDVNGFFLSVETDDKNQVGTLKRRFAVGKNAQGITLLKGEPSFSSNDQILIDELVFYIQQNDLKAT